MSVRARASVMPWWLFLVTGIAWLLISLIVLRFDVTSIAAVSALLGLVFLMAMFRGFTEIFLALRGSKAEQGADDGLGTDWEPSEGIARSVAVATPGPVEGTEAS